MAMCLQRVGNAARHRWQRRLMQHVVSATKDPLHCVEIGHAADSDLEVASERREIIEMRSLARQQIVNDAHPLPIAQ